MTDSRFSPGTVLAERFRLEALIGRGGMGEVWRAEHLQLRASVAVKLLLGERASPEDAKRFLREARAMAQLRSPNVVQVFDVGEHEGALFIAMELLSGKSLKQELEATGRLDLPTTRALLGQIGKGVGKAHAAGIVHRDLKPGNIQITREGDEEIAKVLDFGVAKLQPLTESEAATLLTQGGAMIGTPAYMSPEQLRGREDVDHRADLWAMAVIAYECLLGERPYRDTSIGGLVMAVCSDDPPVPSSRGPAPAGFDAWFAKATAREIATRFQSTEELLAGFARVGTEEGASDDAAAADQAPLTSAPFGSARGAANELPARGRPRRRWVGFAALALAAVAGAALFLRGRGPPDGASGPSPSAPSSTLPASPMPPTKARQLSFAGTAREVALSPDGLTVFYGTREGASDVVVRQALPDGDPKAIAKLAMLKDLEVSPDGRHLLMTGMTSPAEWRTQILDFEGKVVRELPEAAGCTWGPDGRVLLIEQFHAKEMVSWGLDGSIQRLPIVGSYDWLHEVRWSQAAQRILVEVGTTGGDEHLLSMGPAGGATVRLLTDVPRWSALTPTPDGAHLLVGLAQGAESDVVRVPVDLVSGRTGAPEKLLAGTPVDGLSIAADGLRVAYVRRDESSNLWSVKVEGSGNAQRSQLTRGTHLHRSPTLSPDGEAVAFLREKAGHAALHVMPAAGGKESRVTTPDLDVSAFSWRPDGAAFAFTARRDQEPLGLHVIAADGGESRRVPLERPLSGEGGLTWSNGRIWVQLAGNHDYARVDPETGASDLAFGDDVGWRFDPTPSPSGAVAFVWNRPGTKEDGVWLLPREGGPRLVTATSPRWPRARAWKDGDRGVYALFAPEGGIPTIELFPAEGGAGSVVASFDFAPSRVTDADVSSRGDHVVCDVRRSDRDIWTLDLAARP